MKNKIIIWWHNAGSVVTIIVAYMCFTTLTLLGVDVARKTGSWGWLLLAILCGAILALAIGVFYREFTIEELIGEEDGHD